MHLLRQTWLVAGVLLPGLARAKEPKANMKIWAIDSSCTNYFDGTTDDTTGRTGGRDETSYIQESFNRALEMAVATVSALDTAREKRPKRTDDEEGYLDWVRIAESMAVVFGFIPKENEVEQKTDPGWKDLYAVYDAIRTTLPADENNPKYGYNPTFDVKPLLICGDNWNWLDKDGKWPGTDLKVEDTPGYEHSFDDGSVGIWWKPNRWITMSVRKQKPIFCGSLIAGITHLRLDFIQLCDDMFTDSSKAQWVKPTDVEDGMSLSQVMNSLGVFVLHELVHWFAGPEKNDRGEYDWDGSYAIGDLQAVDANGHLVYDVAGYVIAYDRDLSDEERKYAKPVKTYGPSYIFNLARPHPGNPNTGFQKASKNADNFAAFGTMMYHKEWNFAAEAVARRQVRDWDWNDFMNWEGQ